MPFTKYVVFIFSSFPLENTNKDTSIESNDDLEQDDDNAEVEWMKPDQVIDMKDAQEGENDDDEETNDDDADDEEEGSASEDFANLADNENIQNKEDGTILEMADQPEDISNDDAAIPETKELAVINDNDDSDQEDYEDEYDDEEIMNQQICECS